MSAKYIHSNCTNIHPERYSISEKSEAFNSFQFLYSLKAICYQHNSLSCNNCWSTYKRSHLYRLFIQYARIPRRLQM